MNQLLTGRLCAAETTLHIAPGKVLATEIAFAADRPAAIWYRHNFYVWIRLVLDRNAFAGCGRDLYHGQFRSAALRPGDVLEYRLYLDPAHNPACGERNFRGETVPYESLTLMGLKRDAASRSWTRNTSQPGGSAESCRRIFSPGRVTHVLMEAARHAPQADARGRFAFAAPELSLLSLNRQKHLLDLATLVPGAEYNLTLRHSNAAGDWFCERDTLMVPARPVRTATFAGQRWMSAVPSNG